MKKNKVDIIINQLALEDWLLKMFLSEEGQRWHDEGGRIISCLHFDSKITSTLYFFKSKRNIKYFSKHVLLLSNKNMLKQMQLNAIKPANDSL